MPRHPPPVLSPIERPYVFVSTVHPTSSHRAIASPLRGALMRPSLPMTRPIPSITPVRPSTSITPVRPITSITPVRPITSITPVRPSISITPVRPSKPHPATPTTAIKSHAKIPVQAKPNSVNTAASITGVPIAVSPAVNIRPSAVMAQVAGNKSLSVALSNQAVPVSVSHPASVTISNLSSVPMNSPVLAMKSTVSARGNVMINFSAPPAGVTPLAKTRPIFQVSCYVVLCHWMLLCRIDGCSSLQY